MTRMTMFNKNEQSITDPYSIFGKDTSYAHEGANNLFSIPSMVTNINKPKDAVISALQEVGLHKERQGRFTFFLGPATASAIRKVREMRGDLNSFSTQERVSVLGAMCALSTRRLLYAFYRVQNSCMGSHPGVGDLDMATTHVAIPQIFDPVNLPAKGHYLPYFPGLVLPDKSISTIIFALFNRNLGEEGPAREGAISFINRGWPSFSKSSGGRQASHMLYCAFLGIQGGFFVSPLFHKEEYIGTILQGDGSILATSEVHKAKDKDELKAEVQTQLGHDAALEKICLLLSGLPFRSKTTTGVSTVTPDLIESPRYLHIYATAIKVPASTQQQILEEVKNLRFHQTLFDVGDGVAITRLAKALHERDIPSDFPFSLRGGHLFTHSITLSGLLAWGDIAPSPISERNANVSLRVKNRYLEKGSPSGNLNGVPIFYRPVQQASEEWKTYKTSGTLTFRSKGVDKMKRLKIANLGKIFPIDEQPGQELNPALIAFASKKRKRNDEDDVDVREETVGDRKSKKLRKDKQKEVEAEDSNMFDAMGF